MVIADDSEFLVNGMRAVAKNRYFSFLLEELKDNGSKTSSIFLIILSMYVCIMILSHPSLGPGNVTCSSLSLCLSLSVDVTVFSFLFCLFSLGLPFSICVLYVILNVCTYASIFTFSLADRN